MKYTFGEIRKLVNNDRPSFLIGKYVQRSGSFKTADPGQMGQFGIIIPLHSIDLDKHIC